MYCVLSTMYLNEDSSTTENAEYTEEELVLSFDEKYILRV